MAPDNADQLDSIVETAPASQPKRGRVEGVDALRGVCALIVLLSHLQSPFTFDSSNPLVRYLLAPAFSLGLNGAAAVIVFFVISGFSIHYPYRNGATLQVLPFLAARLIRIGVPLLGALALAWASGCGIELLHALVLWSLYAELIYYGIYPLVLQVSRRASLNYVLAPAWVGACIVYIVYRDAQTFHFPGIMLTWILGFPAWLLGMKLAADVDRLRTNANYRIWLLRLAIVATPAIALVLNFHSPIRYGLTLNLFAVLCFFWLRMELGLMHRPFPRMLEQAGKASYSLYLVHIPVLYWLERFHLPTALRYPAAILVALVAAYLFYVTVESLSHGWARSISRSRQTRTS
jgi:peptidoglycan/LPS O-acetylase OafA/YrhL